MHKGGTDGGGANIEDVLCGSAGNGWDTKMPEHLLGLTYYAM